MKNQALFFMLGTFFFGQVHSSNPLVNQSFAQIPLEQKTLSLKECYKQETVYRPYTVDSQLKKRDVTKKSLITIDENNAGIVTQAFLDSLGEALEDTGTAIGDRLDTAINQFKDTLKEQKIIVGETAKDLISILKQKAEEMFPTSEFALSLEEKIRNLKFIISTGGRIDAVEREPINVCCGILSCLLKTSYYYLQRQQEESENQPIAYPYYPQITANSANL